MLIGVISDTHGYLSENACKAFSDCDRIIHAGDIGSHGVLMRLEAIAPVIAVLGNCDYNDYGPSVGRIDSPLLAGVRFLVVHRPGDIPDLAGDVAVVVHGHTHRRRRERIDGVLYLNPGSATEPRDMLAPSVALLTVSGGVVHHVEFRDV